MKYVSVYDPEHRNMPLDDAVELIVSTSESLKKTVGGDTSVQGKASVFTPPNENLKYLLNLAIDKKFLAIEELDEVIEYFEHRRADLAKTQGVKPRKGAVKQPLLPKPSTPTPGVNSIFIITMDVKDFFIV